MFRSYFQALGAHISVLRQEQGMRQAELARAFGVSQQTVFASQWGDRCMPVLMMAELAKVLGMSLKELMGMRESAAMVKHRLSPAGMRHAERFQQLRKT